MHSATPPESDGSADRFDAQLARLNRALRTIAPALRRRGLWIVFGALGGLIGGLLVAATTPTPTVTKRYFKATAVLSLVRPGSAPPGSDAVRWSLQQAQLTIASDAYREAVGAEAGRSTKTVRNHVLSVAYQDTATVDLTAVTKDRGEAVQLAYHAANELNDAIARRLGQRGDASARLRQGQLELLDAVIEQLHLDASNADPTERARIEQSIDEMERRRRRVLASGSTDGASPPEFAITSMPEAIAINSRAYMSRWWAASHSVGVPRVGDSASLADVGAGRGDGTAASRRVLSETDLPVPTKPHPLQPISLGLLAGLVMGLSGVVLGEAWDDRIHDIEHAERATGLESLAGIPHLTQRDIRALFTMDGATDRPRVDRARTRYREAAAVLATQLGLDPRHRPQAPAPTPILVVTSSTPGDGKTTTTAALAHALADTGLDVLAVDGDYHKRSLRRLVRPIPSFVDPDAATATRHERVWYLDDPASADRQATSSVIAGRLMRRARRLAGDFDVVIFDAPPVLATTDAVEYLQYADTALMVVRIDQTMTDAAQPAANAVLRHSRTRPELIVVDVPTTPLDRHTDDGG